VPRANVLLRKLRLGGPDALPEPPFEGKVVAVAAEERHRRVRVRVHEPRRRDEALRVDDAVGARRPHVRTHGGDLAVLDEDRALEAPALRVLREDEGVLHEEGGHGLGRMRG
jgi:hypothetical protein